MGYLPENLDTNTRLRLEQEFFETPFLMSYSGLSKLTFSPAAFYNNYVCKQKGDQGNQGMNEGKLIHCMLLNPETFDDTFLVLPDKMPADNPRQIINTVFEYRKLLVQATSEDIAPKLLIEYKENILETMKSMGVYQALKTDEQRLEKVMDENCMDYWAYLLAKDSKTIVDYDTVEFAKTVARKFQENNQLKYLMGVDRDPMKGKVEVMNEVELARFPDDLPFGRRGFIDNLVIDHGQKKVFINDIKKSSKDIASFPESIEFYRYWMQSATYYQLVLNYLKENVADWSSYQIEFRFIVIDNYLQMAAIKVSDETMLKWIEMTDVELQKAKWHFENRNFSLPHAFASQPDNELVL